MEGEPASSKDTVLLASSPHLFLDGLIAAAATVRATEAYLAVHRGSAVIDGLLEALDERDCARLEGVRIELVTPPPRYVASKESALSHWVGSGTATRVSSPAPAVRGLPRPV